MEPDKQFLVFGWDNYYPCGGTNDKAMSFDTVLEAVIFINNSNYDYTSIYDRINGIEVENG